MDRDGSFWTRDQFCSAGRCSVVEYVVTSVGMLERGWGWG